MKAPWPQQPSSRSPSNPGRPHRVRVVGRARRELAAAAVVVVVVLLLLGVPCCFWAPPAPPAPGLAGVAGPEGATDAAGVARGGRPGVPAGRPPEVAALRARFRAFSASRVARPMPLKMSRPSPMPSPVLTVTWPACLARVRTWERMRLTLAACCCRRLAARAPSAAPAVSSCPAAACTAASPGAPPSRAMSSSACCWLNMWGWVLAYCSARAALTDGWSLPSCREMYSSSPSSLLPITPRLSSLL
mmetsp:Transcript_25816/g.65643  ORF Transcript_25816/g.65643 Transcript_25816/m.65643 type:complete len:246 (+) Transcript_25816:652-1389(+)